ncbi:MAG TPA: DUF4037 domain-containing protein [Chloroflexota bacterium]|nr:DUF4037 domain-containing protein [Chloroflexota bacterium]
MQPRDPFIPGLALSELFYNEAVKPILAARFPHLVYSAAHIGPGSDVLGFDTVRSTDHGWGPKLTLFVPDAVGEQSRARIGAVLSEALPYEIHGYPTHFASPTVDGGRLERISSGPISHGVRIWTIRAFFDEQLGIDPYQEMAPVDWLVLPQQRLRSVTAGKVFHDGLQALEPLRRKLRYYPRDVWLYMLAVQWRRISQEEPFMARCGDAGDEVGSRIIAARLIHDLMQLCFLLEQTYAPYSKWFGTAFERLRCAAQLTPIFQAIMQSATWQERQDHFSRAYEAVALLHNALAITPPLATQVSPFYTRPYLVIHGERFAEAIREAIESPAVRALSPHIGSIDQFVDATDVLAYTRPSALLKALYQ